MDSIFCQGTRGFDLIEGVIGVAPEGSPVGVVQFTDIVMELISEEITECVFAEITVAFAAIFI